jgi:hypothetical protein
MAFRTSWGEPAEAPNVKLTLTVSAQQMAEIESLVIATSGFFTRPNITRWLLSIGLQKVRQADGLAHAVEEYWRGEDMAERRRTPLAIPEYLKLVPKDS